MEIEQFRSHSSGPSGLGQRQRFQQQRGGPLGLLAARQDAVERGLVTRAALRGVPTLLRGSSFAYRTKRPLEGGDTFENGVYAHGPEADAVADEYVELLRRWDRDLRGGPGARIEVFPATRPTSELSR
ncbi:protein-L-isoaspartate(D-aspartate) O-methyltransferase [Actinopolyspora xinjiangensis]|uniref:Protein-L-isoaspartate(D-aspartate) O-methyltransferase n=1 Tax=Actinopolyspora xinjiangensis TaxID=405564 RepID=A0A1H0TTZ9_9ACTN|nr:hypothetical protein [Actinopolyspora xinjiangensis]SDP57527.1 protein-L-isoaspartate(D-aspartate) O-methyltransferase [Actinopolyspora xinjiangensis]